MKRLLIVDDERDIRLSLQEVLRNRYEILLAGSAEAAAVLLEKKRVDAILLDVQDIPHFFRRNFRNPLLHRNKLLPESEMAS